MPTAKATGLCLLKGKPISGPGVPSSPPPSQGFGSPCSRPAPVWWSCGISDQTVHSLVVRKSCAKPQWRPLPFVCELHWSSCHVVGRPTTPPVNENQTVTGFFLWAVKDHFCHEELTGQINTCLFIFFIKKNPRTRGYTYNIQVLIFQFILMVREAFLITSFIPLLGMREMETLGNSTAVTLILQHGKDKGKK